MLRTFRAATRCNVPFHFKFTWNSLSNSVKLPPTWRISWLSFKKWDAPYHFYYYSALARWPFFFSYDFQKSLHVTCSQKLPLWGQLFLLGPLGGSRRKLLTDYSYITSQASDTHICHGANKARTHIRKFAICCFQSKLHNPVTPQVLSRLLRDRRLCISRMAGVPLRWLQNNFDFLSH